MHYFMLSILPGLIIGLGLGFTNLLVCEVRTSVRFWLAFVVQAAIVFGYAAFMVWRSQNGLS